MKVQGIFFGVIAFAVIGCGVGDAPKPMSQQEVKEALDKSKPEDQIHFIQSSPLNQKDKKAKIDEIKAKYNLTDSDVERMSGGAPKNVGTGG